MPLVVSDTLALQAGYALDTFILVKYRLYLVRKRNSHAIRP